MPGKQVKNWPKYHRLRKKGYTKEQAAKITNKNPGKKKRKSR